MTSRNMKRFAASHGAVLVLAGMLVLGSGLTATAQSLNGTPVRSLEGTWRVQLTVLNCQTGKVIRTFPALFAFAVGGTLTVTTAGQSPALNATGIGIWQRMTVHSYSAESEAFIFDTTGAWTSTSRLTRVIDLSNDGDTFTDTVGLQIFDTSGNQIVTGCGTSVGNRMK
jgi:hypothetical protein